MKMKLFTSVAFAALLIPGAAYAQSTGSTDFDKGGEDIVVTGTKTKKDVIIPDVPKTRITIGSELLSRARPGQTVNDIINLVPGVSFQNNDATGAAGGTFTIRGFDSTRISQTLDGIPLNDTGNYAIYSNQQQDPETLESVSVNLGTTDVDSPTASAVGGTVNIRTRIPSEKFGVIASGTYGQYAGRGDPLTRDIFRVFGMVDTGDIAHTGIRAFFSGSKIEAFNPFNNYGRLRKQQYNARFYKSLGSNGDFLSIAGQWNENRNNFLGSVPLRNDLFANAVTTANTAANLARIAGPNSANRAPITAAERYYTINAPCQVNSIARPGIADVLAVAPTAPTAGASCGTEFDRRYNPSNTGNVRFGSRFTIIPNLILSVDASYQYTKANGGGTVSLLESAANLSQTAATEALTGVINSGPNAGNASPAGFGYYVGRDLNGDGDRLDTILGISPSQTQTRRYVGVVGLAYEISDTQRVRVNYTVDYGRHRQTGEVGLVQQNGEPFDVFPVNNPLKDATGQTLQKRDRLSYAILNQVSGEYRGKFLEEKLTVALGVRAPFFRRELNQNCFTVAANGNVACVTPSGAATYAAANPYTYFGPSVTTVGGVARPTTGSCANVANACVVGFAGPQRRVRNYNRVLPNVGATFNVTSAISAYASYAKGLSVPGTENLYNSLYYPDGTPQSRPAPETTDSFDLGVRYTTSKVQAQLAGWYTKFQNRTVSVYDIESDTSVYRNLGPVDKYGVDASLSYRPTRNLLLYVFGSYLHSKIKNNTEAGTIATTANGTTTYTTTFFQTAGKREGGSPDWMFGGRAQGTIDIFDLGIQAKYTGGRYVNDENRPVYTCVNAASTSGATLSTVGGLCPTAANVPAASVNPNAQEYQIYGAKIPSYVLVDLDLRINLGKLVNNDRTFFQLNVSNLFDKNYIGGLSGSSGFVGLPNRYQVGNAVIGTPRSITGTLQVGF
ncbi:TonB-dependent receptor [Sphingomonas sp. MMS24-J45]|uniref:TonB-dependent receptor n=1 Tax=Sphingomonas sp. MMS24-J45 TaxID=3238806 RepID=UPI00384A555E